MATKPTFLTVPLEIRLHIYSRMLTNDRVLNIVVNDMDSLLRQDLFRVCRQMCYEANEYYWNDNNFLHFCMYYFGSTLRA